MNTLFEINEKENDQTAIKLNISFNQNNIPRMKQNDAVVKLLVPTFRCVVLTPFI